MRLLSIILFFAAILVAAHFDRRAKQDCCCIPADAVEETPRDVVDAWLAARRERFTRHD
jgi:hypothetical protein